MNYEKIKSNAESYLALVDEERQREKAYFDSKAAREREIEELTRLSGGKLKISSANRRTTAGVQISDDPLDFRKQIDYFNSVNRQNLGESRRHANVLWGYFASVYAYLAQSDYEKYERLCSETELLFTGGQADSSAAQDSSTEFVRKYPVEARDNAIAINKQITDKKSELIERRKILSEAMPLMKSSRNSMSSMSATSS